VIKVEVKEKDGNLQIKWLLSKIDIPLSDITEVLSDDTYGGEEPAAIRLGFPYGNSDRVVIKTVKETYIIFTNIGGLKEKIFSFMN